jgi:FkbM family methyltransferase
MENRTSTHPLERPKDTRFKRRLLHIRCLLTSALLIRSGYSLRELGERSSGCAYTICPVGLGAKSVVYSGGVGKDISFEHALVKNFGCSVIVFDPSPIGLATMRLPMNQGANIRFFPVGLAGKCGKLRMAPPFDQDGDSWFGNDSLNGTIEVQCVDLVTLMKENQHEHIDLLKIDIEGAEYGVIDQILDRRIPVRQIVVEFHDDILPGIRLSHTARAVFKLLSRGYKLVSQEAHVDTFLQPRLLI